MVKRQHQRRHDPHRLHRPHPHDPHDPPPPHHHESLLKIDLSIESVFQHKT